MNFIPVPDHHYDTYNARMASIIDDKLFFLDQIKVDVIVDYGCADGTLLSHIQDQRPEIALVGYDVSDVELAHAARKVPHGSFFRDWDALARYLETHHQGQRIALVASSVIHEIYAYGGTAEGEAFWTRLLDGPFSTFIMRDMALSAADYGILDTSLADKLLTGPVGHLAKEYEACWGSLDLREHATHFLLKYRYTDNWEHELNEYYLPLTVEAIKEKLAGNFAPTFHATEALPFLQEMAQVELGVSFPCKTHLKLIAQRINAQ
jgi:hypothetical protein